MTALWHFAALRADQQAQVVQRLAIYGHDVHRIVELTGFSPELVRKVLAIDMEKPA